MRVVVCIVLAALAGCAQQPEAPQADDVEQEPPLVQGNATLPLSVEWIVSNATLPVGVPTNVTLAGNATENVTWSASLHDEVGNETAAFSGAGLPATIEVVLPAPGNYTLTATASGAGYQPANATLVLQALAGAVAEPVTYPDPVVFTGTSQVGNPGHSYQCVRDGVDGDIHEVAPAELGWLYRLTSGYEVYWWNGGSYVSRGGGQVGATHAEVCDTGGAGGSYTLVLWHPDAPEPE